MDKHQKSVIFTQCVFVFHEIILFVFLV